MGLIETIRSTINRFLMPDEYFDRELQAQAFERQISYSYYVGNQRRQMKAKPMQADDNITTNYTQLVVERSLSLLLGGGVKFDLPGEQDAPEQLYIDGIVKANNFDVMLHRAGQYAGLVGTGYIKIVPDGITKRGGTYPRLVPLDSRWMFIKTVPEDMDTVQEYIMRYNVAIDGEEVARKELIRWDTFDGETNQPASWVIENYTNSKRSNGKWELISSEPWPYPFPPIVHWANLPKPASVYGESDIANIVELQDRINFVSSNISRIIRYHAHPKTWGANVNLGNKVSWGGDELVTVTGDNARLENLEMQSDLASSRAYLESLRQSLFDVTRTVDISSMSDKMGQLTNFGLRVLYGDAIAKLHTKQALMGEALEDLIYRLLVLGNQANTDPGKVIFPDNLPTNEREELEARQIELNNGLVSKQTVAVENGRNWELEQERITEEQAQSGNIGQALLQAFNTGA